MFPISDEYIDWLAVLELVFCKCGVNMHNLYTQNAYSSRGEEKQSNMDVSTGSGSAPKQGIIQTPSDWVSSSKLTIENQCTTDHSHLSGKIFSTVFQVKSGAY